MQVSHVVGDVFDFKSHVAIFKLQDLHLLALFASEMPPGVQFLFCQRFQMLF